MQRSQILRKVQLLFPLLPDTAERVSYYFLFLMLCYIAEVALGNPSTQKNRGKRWCLPFSLIFLYCVFVHAAHAFNRTSRSTLVLCIIIVECKRQGESLWHRRQLDCRFQRIPQWVFAKSLQGSSSYRCCRWMPHYGFCLEWRRLACLLRQVFFKMLVVFSMVDGLSLLLRWGLWGVPMIGT